MATGQGRTSPTGLDSAGSPGSESAHKSPFTWDVVVTVVVFYVIAALIIGIQIGPWQAVRSVGLNGLIVLAWLLSAHRLLRNQPAPDEEAIRYPRSELAVGLGILAVVVLWIINAQMRWLALPDWSLYAVWYGSLALLFVGLRYFPHALGLRWPSRRGWLTLLAAVAINAVVGALAQLLPQGEMEQAVGSGDLSQQIVGPWVVILLIVGLLFRAALPEEWLLRVTLQPRLARFMPLGWAILIQALLFSMGHLPQKLMQNGLPLPLAIAYTLTLDNGLLAGYLWKRERSLPLLLLLHLFAFPRFGL